MTDPKDTAFPSTRIEERASALQAGRVPVEIHCSGLTKREYFAACALDHVIWEDNLDTAHEDIRRSIILKGVKATVEIADALIAELNK